MKNPTRYWIEKNMLALIVVFFVTLFFADLFFLAPNFSKKENGDAIVLIRQDRDITKEKNRANAIPKLSEIRTPRIDDEAASIQCIESGSSIGMQKACNTLPADIWIFLLAAYVGLLVFNLAWDFNRKKHIQWFWEILYTIFFLLGWRYLDQCLANVWFPIYIINFGLVIYFIYLYFFEKKIKSAQQN